MSGEKVSWSILTEMDLNPFRPSSVKKSGKPHLSHKFSEITKTDTNETRLTAVHSFAADTMSEIWISQSTSHT